MSPKNRKRDRAVNYAIPASIALLVASAALLIVLRYQTFFQPLLLIALILLLPAAVNLSLLIPRSAPTEKVSVAPAASESADGEEMPRPRLKARIGRAFARGCRAIGRSAARNRTTLLSLLIVVLVITANVFFWLYARGKSYSTQFSYFTLVLVGILFVLFIVFGKWCKHRTPAATEDDGRAARYEIALLRNFQSAFALGRVALLLTAVAMAIKLIGLYDFSKWLTAALSVLFAYITVFTLISLFVVLVRHELELAPEITAPAPGVEGGDLGILNYLEKNTGISMRSLWSIQMIKKSLPYAALLSVLLLWCVTGVSMVGSHQEGAHYRFGKLQEKTLSPGLHLTLPWPFDRVEVYDTKTVHKMTIGYLSEEDADNIWTGAHGVEEYRLLLGGGNELVSVNLRVMYRIADLRAYLTYNAAPELLMSSAAYEIVTARTITSDLDAMLSTDRAVFADTFREELMVHMQKYNTGLEVVSVVLESIHPPVEIADAYQELISAEIKAEKIRLDAEAYYGERLAWAWVEYDSETAAARIRQHEGIANAKGAVAEFMASVSADNAYYCPAVVDGESCRQLLTYDAEKELYVCDKCHKEHDPKTLVSASAEYRYYKYMKAISEAYGGGKLIIVGNGVKEENIYIGGVPAVGINE